MLEDPAPMCSVCGKQVNHQGPATFTQWIFADKNCRCNMPKQQSSLSETQKGMAQSAAEAQAVLCKTCGKEISATKRGSITQWIFSADSCRCQMPTPMNASERTPAIGAALIKMPAFSFEEEIDTEGIDVDPTSFPIDRYKPIRFLGKGAIGAVYLCHDSILRKNVAVKCLLRITDIHVISFQTEAKCASKLHHQSIIEVLDFGTTSGGTPFMVMEYFKSISLEEMIKQTGALSPQTVIAVFEKICDALSYMHAHGVFHRDLKPSNVLISADGNSIRIIDFGLSKTTQDIQTKTIIDNTILVGTPAYMSPDQVAGLPYDATSEVYSVGCMMF